MDQNEPSAEIPSPIDFDDPGQVKAWVEATVEKRPWRPRFFAAFAKAVGDCSAGNVRILELGSGPGHLARAILEACPHVGPYVLLDFSDVMHGIAREHLGPLADRARIASHDFRRDDWAANVGAPDIVVTMQAAHEVRHKTRLPALLDAIHRSLKDEGMLLFCDHYTDETGTKNAGLYLRREEQPGLLENAGFQDVERLHDEGGMALYRCFKKPAANTG
jgi:SAM-dependent methyltransferase